MTDQSDMESLMKEILREIRELWDTLMGLEMELVDQLEVHCNLVIDFMNCLELKTKEQLSITFFIFAPLTGHNQRL